MKKIEFFKRFPLLKSPKHILNMFLVAFFAFVFTGILVSKYVFFQTIVGSDNNSKVMVVAPKNIEVVDIIKTEIRRREAVQNVKPVYVPADRVYITNNLKEIIEDINQIRQSSLSYKDKERDLNTMLDISDKNSKDYVISYFINANDESLNRIFHMAERTLSSVLGEGITEKYFEENLLPKIIRRNVDTNTTNNQITVMTALLEQVIVPNMIIDEAATSLARRVSRDSVSPIKVKFNKGDTIVKVGEPITQVKKEALSKAGYNILNIKCFYFLYQIRYQKYKEKFFFYIFINGKIS